MYPENLFVFRHPRSGAALLSRWITFREKITEMRAWRTREPRPRAVLGS